MRAGVRDTYTTEKPFVFINGNPSPGKLKFQLLLYLRV